jgi:hypothetical protein
MAPRIFVSFAAEDVQSRNFLVAQAKNKRVPFEFADMSLAEPFDSKWKTNCRERIRQCDGFIALLSNHTWRAHGARWEMKCAREELDHVIGIHIHADDKRAIPPELRGARVVEWRWENIARFIQRINNDRAWLDRLFD